MTIAHLFTICVAFIVGWWLSAEATREKPPYVLPLALLTVGATAVVLAVVLMYRGATVTRDTTSTQRPSIVTTHTTTTGSITTPDVSR